MVAVKENKLFQIINSVALRVQQYFYLCNQAYIFWLDGSLIICCLFSRVSYLSFIFDWFSSETDLLIDTCSPPE